MGNQKSKKRQSNDSDDVSKKKRFSFSRHSHDNQVKDKAFDLSEEVQEEIRNIVLESTANTFYPAYYYVQ